MLLDNLIHHLENIILYIFLYNINNKVFEYITKMIDIWNIHKIQEIYKE